MARLASLLASETLPDVLTVVSPEAEVANAPLQLPSLPQGTQHLKQQLVPVESVLAAIARGLEAKTKDGREDIERQLNAASLGGKLHRLWSDDTVADIRMINFTLANFTPEQLTAFTSALMELGNRFEMACDSIRMKHGSEGLRVHETLPHLPAPSPAL